MRAALTAILTAGAVTASPAVAHADPYEDLVHELCQQLAAREPADQIVASMVGTGQITRVNAMATVALAVRGFYPDEEHPLPSPGSCW